MAEDHLANRVDLRVVVDERDCLRADLIELDVHPPPPVDLEPLDDPEPRATIIPFPARNGPARTPVVSPKIARLMRAPRRPGLGRSGSSLMGGSGEEAAEANNRAS
jgi:hypothetical protein